MARYADSAIVYTQNPTVCDFSSPGSYTWTVPANVTRVTMELWGAGGGGGSKCCCDCYHGSFGGASGGYTRKSFTVTPGGSYCVCVGYGGMVPTVGSCTFHWCCYGQQGTTTWVQGPGLSNFCAVGGDGSTSMCFTYCGCCASSGCGYGGDFNACGGAGVGGGVSDSSMYLWTASGGPAFTNAGFVEVSEHCNYCNLGYYGKMPGGGGTGVPNTQCCCCSQAGVGANGMVRIHW